MTIYVCLDKTQKKWKFEIFSDHQRALGMREK